MFTRKTLFSNRLKFGPGAFRQIINKLKDAGFNNISVKIPKQYLQFGNLEFSAEEFLGLSYNFVSQILIAKNSTETIKILFINNSKSKANFDDLTFPSSNSELSKYSIETDDPIRIIGIVDFIDHLLRESSIRSPFIAQLQSFFIILTTTYLLISSFILLGSFDQTQGPVLWSIFTENIYILSFLFIVSIFYIFFHTVTPGGLYLNKFEHPLISFSKRIIIGDFKDNLIINFLLTISKILIGGFIVNILWFFLGDIIINAIKYLPSLLG